MNSQHASRDDRAPRVSPTTEFEGLEARFRETIANLRTSLHERLAKNHDAVEALAKASVAIDAYTRAIPESDSSTTNPSPDSPVIALPSKALAALRVKAIMAAGASGDIEVDAIDGRFAAAWAGLRRWERCLSLLEMCDAGAILLDGDTWALIADLEVALRAKLAHAREHPDLRRADVDETETERALAAIAACRRALADRGE